MLYKTVQMIIDLVDKHDLTIDDDVSYSNAKDLHDKLTIELSKVRNDFEDTSSLLSVIRDLKI